MKTFPRLFISGSVAALLAFTGCAHKQHDGKASNPPAPDHPSQPSALCRLKDDDGNTIPANFTGTTGTTSQSHAANHVNQILNVQSACCENFDRLVFRVDGIHEPTYTIGYANPPFTDCGSGNTHVVPGNAFLKIKMTPAEGHGNGQATLPRETAYHCQNLKHLSITCDFESDLTFVIGLNAKKPYRVIELQNPTRLVVDIKH